MVERICPIWRTGATVETWGEGLAVDSPRAGGQYKLLGLAQVMVSDISDPEQKVVLTDYILEANLRRNPPEIHPNMLLEILQRSKTLSPIDRLNSLITFLFHKKKSGDIFFSCGLFTELLAICGSNGLEKHERGMVPKGMSPTDVYLTEPASICLPLIKYAHAKGLLEIDWSENLPSVPSRISLTFEGEIYAEKLGATIREGDRIFVAMWFDDDKTKKFYLECAYPAIWEAGYEAIRVDEELHNEKICDRIIAEIRRAKAVLVDLTCSLANDDSIGIPRGGVYYEAGFAQGLGLPIIWTVEGDTAKKQNVVHFDIQQYAQTRWTYDEAKAKGGVLHLPDAKEAIKQRILRTLGDGPKYEERKGKCAPPDSRSTTPKEAQ